MLKIKPVTKKNGKNREMWNILFNDFHIVNFLVDFCINGKDKTFQVIY